VINAGRLRERVTIQRQVAVPDGAGGQTRSWVDVATVRAEVLPRRGNAEAGTEALQGVQQWQMVIRFRRDIAIDDRIVWEGKTHRVLAAVDETGDRMFTTIYTEAGVVTA
jgi:SPP1 family predicted phage head-tail adaptor